MNFEFSAIGSVFFGDQKEVFDVSTNLLLFGPNYVPVRHQFDLSVLVRNLKRLALRFELDSLHILNDF